MTVSKRSLTVGILVFLALSGFILFEYADFFALGGWGKALFALLLILAGVSGAAAVIRPDPESERFRPRLYTAWLAFVFALAPLIAVMAVERLNGNFIWELYDASYLFDNYAVAFVCFAAAFALFGSVRASILAMSPVFLFFGIANMYVKEFKGSPLLPIDAGSIATAANVAKDYDYSFGFEMVVAVVLTVFIMALASRLFMPQRSKRARLALHIIPFVFTAATLAVFYGTDLPIELGMKPDFFNQTRGYENRGAIGQFACNTRFMRNSAPAGYDAGETEDILAAYLDLESPYILDSAMAMQGESLPAAASGTGMAANSASSGTSGTAAQSDSATPDIVVIMNESFSDLQSVLPFETSEEVLPNLNALTDNTIRGTAYVSVRGTGTSNTEYEFLTGNTTAFLPAGSNAYQLYLRGEQPGLVSTLLSLGYTAEAMHPYFAVNWNRPAVYEGMGFERFLSIADMFPAGFGQPYLTTGEEQREFVKLVGDTWPDEQIMVAGYVSDAYDYEQLIASYETRDPSKPWFHFNITMQNHSPYTAYYGNFERSVHVLNVSETYYEAENYLSRARESDRALGSLIDYFEEAESPVLLLFFGDHQPIVEPEFIEEVSGRPLADWSDEESQSLYTVPFVIWANYDIPEGTVERISINYLRPLLLQTAGLPLTAYDNYLAALYPDYPVISAQGCRDAAGSFFTADDPGAYLKDPLNAEQALRTYSFISYNNLSDKARRLDEMYYLDK